MGAAFRRIRRRKKPKRAFGLSDRRPSNKAASAVAAGGKRRPRETKKEIATHLGLGGVRGGKAHTGLPPSEGSAVSAAQTRLRGAGRGSAKPESPATTASRSRHLRARFTGPYLSALQQKRPRSRRERRGLIRMGTDEYGYVRRGAGQSQSAGSDTLCRRSQGGRIKGAVR